MNEQERYNKAYDEGYNEGHGDGLSDGLEKGRVAVYQIERAIAQLQSPADPLRDLTIDDYADEMIQVGESVIAQLKAYLDGIE